MKNSSIAAKRRKPTAGSRMIASLKEAVDCAEGKDDIRRRLGLSQAEFAAKFGFRPATLRHWEQRRTRPDGPARALLAVIARHPDAVEDPYAAPAESPSIWKRQHLATPYKLTEWADRF